MNINLQEYFKAGISYQEYWSFFQDLVKKAATTGPNQNEFMVNYTKLNLSRSKRVSKQFKFENESQQYLAGISKPIKWLVITEAWCGDAAQTLPIMHLFEEEVGDMDLRIVWRDENPDLMDNFETDGSRSIPIVIQMDENFTYIAHWGPRPKEAQQMMLDFKASGSEDNLKFYEDLQDWYNKDKGRSSEIELLELLKKA